MNPLVFLKILANKNYRAFFAGQAVATTGSLMQIVAINWLVYRMTESGLLLGLFNFVRASPVFFLGLFTGALLDRWPRQRILFITQAVTSCLAFFLFFLFQAGVLVYWMVLVIYFLIGCLTAFETPSRQASVSDLTLDREDLRLAISFDSFLFNFSRVIGPSLGGILIAAASESICFFINALCYAVGAFSLLFVRLPRKPKEETKTSFLKEVGEGIAYAAKSPPIWKTLLLVGLLSVVGIPFIVLMLPIFAKDILHGGPQTLGFLHSAWGSGAILGALFLASRKKPNLERKILLTSFFFGLALIFFSQTRVILLSLAFVGLAGFFRVIQIISGNTYLQTIVEENKRGRIMTFFTMTFLGLAPFGSLLAGSAAEALGAPMAVFLGGSLCVACALLFAFHFRSKKQ